MKSTSKTNYPKTKYKVRKPSMLSEKAASRLTSYLTIITIVMLLGLLRTDGLTRGFPNAWYVRGHILTGNFFSSLMVVAGVVISADFIAKLLMRIREPALKLQTKMPDLTSDYSDTIEMSVSDKDHELPETRESDFKNIKPLLNNKPAVRSSKEGRKGSSGALIAVIAIIITIISMMAGFLSEDSDDDVFFNDDDIEFDEDSDEYYDAYSAAASLSENVFFSMEHDEESMFENIADDKTVAGLFDAADWTYLSYEEVQTLISENEGYALCKYVLADYEGDEYPTAVLMNVTYDDSEAMYQCTLKGLSICSENVIDLYEFRNNSDSLQADAIEIDKDSINIGTCEINGMPILLINDLDEALENDTGEEA